jgi:hypothetical protein
LGQYRHGAITGRGEILAQVPSGYILRTEDSAAGADWAGRSAKQRLGTEAICLEGGHMPMLSRPARLADALDQVVRGS